MFFLLNCVEVGIVSGKYVMCNLLGVVLKRKKKTRWFPLPRLSFGGPTVQVSF